MSKVLISIIASCLYVFWPIQLFYNILLTPEILNIFFVLLTIFFITIANTNYFSKKVSWQIICYIISGINLGISGLFKPVDKILIIAFLIIIAVRYIEYKRDFSDNNNNRKKIYKLIGLTFLTIFISTITIQLGYTYLDSYIGKPVNRNPSPHFLYLGLNHISRGVWSPEVAVYPGICEKYNFNFEKANKEVYKLIKNDIKNNKFLSYEYFNNKITIGWGDNLYFDFIDSTINNDNLVAINKSEWIKPMKPLSQVYWVCIVFFMIIGVLFEIINKKTTDIIFLSTLYLFGFSILLLGIEVQPRYKCILYPFISIVSAYGIYYLLEFIKKDLSISKTLIKQKK